MTMSQRFHRRRGDNAPLTNKQKAELSRLAQEAHAFLTSKGAIDEALESWRRAESIQACGRRISEGLNGDFSLIQAHFLMLAGKSSKALDSALQADSNDERQARFKLAQLCKQLGKPVPALEGASLKQIWAVFFNLKNAAKAARVRPAQAPTATLEQRLAQAVREERYEDAAQLKREIQAAKDHGDDEIPF